MEQQAEHTGHDGDLSPERRGRVTASGVGGILGLSPYQKKEQVLRVMVREALGLPREFKGNPATLYGKLNEEGARWQYSLECGADVERAPFFKFEEWLGASPDGLVCEDGLVEIKCPYRLRDGGQPNSIAEQPHYYAQMQIQMYCTGREWCDFYQWTPHHTMRERVEIDLPWLGEHLPKLRGFYSEEFLPGLEDPKHAQSLRATHDNPSVVLLAEQYASLRQESKEIAARMKEILGQIVEATGEKSANIGEYKLTRRDSKGSIKYKEVVADHLPELDLDQYRGKASTSWVLV